MSARNIFPFMPNVPVSAPGNGVIDAAETLNRAQYSVLLQLVRNLAQSETWAWRDFGINAQLFLQDHMKALQDEINNS